MAIKHVVVCDYCDGDDDLLLTITPPAPNGGLRVALEFAVPGEWHEYDGHHFCSYECVAAYAQKVRHAGEARAERERSNGEAAAVGAPGQP